MEHFPKVAEIQQVISRSSVLYIGIVAVLLFAFF